MAVVKKRLDDIEKTIQHYDEEMKEMQKKLQDITDSLQFLKEMFVTQSRAIERINNVVMNVILVPEKVDDAVQNPDKEETRTHPKTKRSVNLCGHLNLSKRIA